MHCENCYSPMVRQVKRFGRISTWYVCPKCGLREPIGDYNTSLEVRMKVGTSGFIPMVDEESEQEYE